MEDLLMMKKYRVKQYCRYIADAIKNGWFTNHKTFNIVNAQTNVCVMKIDENTYDVYISGIKKGYIKVPCLAYDYYDRKLSSNDRDIIKSIRYYYRYY